LPPGAPRDLCPRCLFGVGLANDCSSASDPSDQPATLALSASDGGVLDALAATLGTVPRVLLRDEASSDPPSPMVRPCSTEMPAGMGGPGRLQLLGEIAQGGMGAVLKGRDTDLGRDLAVKVLREDLRDNVAMVHRFVEEAQIAGQLQHPGIIPVYELGQFADGRPYFAMKLVKGHTLAALLEARTSPAEDWPRFLAIFAQVAQTVAYAHARGVIHRDLKPSNIMVGSFGEVQVMDWGLAKVLPRGGVADDARAGKVLDNTIITTARSGSDSDRSRAGSVLGTPAYMAPEQARGEVDFLDERGDVFALGSILCEILTGKPAFVGRTSGEIMRKAASGDVADAFDRLDGCGADAELVSIAKDCLAHDPEQRPRDAGVVAARCGAYLAGVQEKLRTAERERAVALARAVEERKRRRAQAALGLTFTTMVVLCGAFAWWTQDQRRARLAESERAMGQALEKAIVRFGQASGAGRDPALWAEARAAALVAHEQAVSTAAPAAVLDRINALLTEIDRIEKNRRLVASLLDIHAGMGDRVLATGDQDFAGADLRYAQALRDYGTDLSALAPERGAALLRELGGEVTVELAAALDDWAYVGWVLTKASPKGSGSPLGSGATGGEWLFPITILLDPDPIRSRIRDAAKRRDGTALAAIAGEMEPAAQSAETINLLSVYLFFNNRFEDAVRVLRAAQPHHPGDFQINHNLAFFLNASGQPGTALPFAMAAIAARPQSSVAWLDAANALKALGREEESYDAFRRVVERSPAAWSRLLPLASRLDRAGKHEAAVAECRRAAAAAARHPVLFFKFDEDAPRLRPRDDPAALLAPLREAVKANPESAAARMTLARFLLIAGNQEEAVIELREAARLTSDINLYFALSSYLETRGRTDEAVAGYRTAIRLKPDYAPAHYNLATVLSDQGKSDEAIAEFRTAIRLKPDFAEAHCNLGQLLRVRGDYPGAIAMLRKGHELGTRQPGWRFPSAVWVAVAERQAELAERLPALLKGEDRPRDSADRLALAQFCYDTKRHATAVRFWAEVLAADPKLGDDRQTYHRYNAGCAAALAGGGQGKDDPPPDEVARAKLRAQALDWLRADRAAWAKALDGAPQERDHAALVLRHWQRDPDLAGVRDPEGLAKLPEIERMAWRDLWTDVDALLKRAEVHAP
jgi:serine/threonine-protein kinase